MRLAVLADIHGNVIALEAVLSDLARRGGADMLVDLGDRVSGPLWPAETLARLAALAPVGVRGNHDRPLATDDPDGLGPTDRFAWERLTPRQRASLAALPTTAEPAPGVLAFHARPRRDDAYLLETARGGRQVRANRGKIERRLGDVGAARLLLCGHSHRPDVVRLRSGSTVVNPGSVGLPAATLEDGPRPHVMETGTPDARYALVELGDPTPVVSLLAVPYDHEAAARQAEAHGFPQWADWVRTGWARPGS